MSLCCWKGSCCWAWGPQIKIRPSSPTDAESKRHRDIKHIKRRKSRGEKRRQSETLVGFLVDFTDDTFLNALPVILLAVIHLIAFRFMIFQTHRQNRMHRINHHNACISSQSIHIIHIIITSHPHHHTIRFELTVFPCLTFQHPWCIMHGRSSRGNCLLLQHPGPHQPHHSSRPHNHTKSIWCSWGNRYRRNIPLCLY